VLGAQLQRGDDGHLKLDLGRPRVQVLLIESRLRAGQRGGHRYAFPGADGSTTSKRDRIQGRPRVILVVQLTGVASLRRSEGGVSFVSLLPAPRDGSVTPAYQSCVIASMYTLDLHRIPNAQLAFLDLGNLGAAGIVEYEGVPDPQGLPVNLECPPPVAVLDPVPSPTASNLSGI